MEFKKTERLNGVKFRMVRTPNVKPVFQVFRYMGSMGPVHYFRGIRGNNITIGFTLEQIASLSIEPFCLNTAFLEVELLQQPTIKAVS